jgi:hypothetical protein
MPKFTVSVSHSCDSCGKPNADRDEVLCPSCKAALIDTNALHSVTDRLQHVAFMAWLIECRDQRDARIMRELTLHKTRFNNDDMALRADCVGIIQA